MTIDYDTVFAGLGTTIGAALSDALPVAVPVFAGLVGLGLFVRTLGKFGIRR